MGSKYKKVGGRQSAEGLSENFISFLNNALQGGLGAGKPAGQGAVGGARGIYGDILSGGAGQLGGSLQQILEKSQARDVGQLRSRFGQQGGMSLGTPAAFAESKYRAEAAPQAATQIGELQLKALSPILSGISSIYGNQTPAAEMVEQKSGFQQFMTNAGDIAGSVSKFFTPGIPSPGPNAMMAGQDLGQLASAAPSFSVPSFSPSSAAPIGNMWNY